MSSHSSITQPRSWPQASPLPWLPIALPIRRTPDPRLRKLQTKMCHSVWPVWQRIGIPSSNVISLCVRCIKSEAKAYEGQSMIDAGAPRVVAYRRLLLPPLPLLPPPPLPLLPTPPPPPPAVGVVAPEPPSVERPATEPSRQACWEPSCFARPASKACLIEKLPQGRPSGSSLRARSSGSEAV